MGRESWQCLSSAVVPHLTPSLPGDSDSRWCFLAGRSVLSVSSLEHKSVREGGRRGGRTEASSLAGGVRESFERKHTRLELTVDSNPRFTGKAAVFEALSSYFWQFYWWNILTEM